MFKAIAGVVAVLVLLLILFFVFRGDEEASAEERYDGVHLCSPSQQAGATAEARTSSAGAPTRGAGNEGPLFAQNSSTWGKEEYDHGSRQDIGCGTTIEQCGCAMTSVATVLELFQVLSTPEGTDLNPSSLNAWFNQGAKLTTGGWVSQGYVFGNVVWTAINGWTPSVVQGGEGGQVVSTELAPSTTAPVEKPKGIRFKGWGSGSEEEIRAELRAGRPVVLEVPGHYIAAVGLDGDQILINDPYYADRVTLASYTGRVKSARLFEPSSDMRSLMVTVPANMRVELKDARGRKVGTLGGNDPAEAEQSAAAEIPGAVYRYEEAWRDPTCTERAPPPGSGTATIFIPLPDKGIYTVEVIDPKGKRTDAAVYISDVNGKRKMETHEGGGETTFEIDYDPGQTQTTTTDPATPTPTTAPTAPAATTPPRVTTAPGAPTATTPPTATATASATPIPVTIPTFTVSLDEVNQDSPCSITVSWEVTGPPDTKVYLLKGAGDTVGTDPANRIYETGPGKGTFNEGFKAGIRTYRLQAVSSTGSALKAPVTANPICIDAFYTSDKCSQVVGWQVSGGPQGARYTLFRRNAGTTQWTAIRNGAVTYGQPMSINEDLGSSITYEYTLQVAVQSRLVTTNPISEKWDGSGGCIG
jgi:hypothetical protein